MGRNVTGATCSAWQPPIRLVLAWRLGADWKYYKDLLTEIEVRFTADGSRTRIDFEHRKLENWGSAAAQAARRNR